jgi:hypothetical protein
LRLGQLTPFPPMAWMGPLGILQRKLGPHRTHAGPSCPIELGVPICPMGPEVAEMGPCMRSIPQDPFGSASRVRRLRVHRAISRVTLEDITPSQGERSLNDGFFGVREYNVCSSEPTPAARHRHESTWGCFREHGLLFRRELDHGYGGSRALQTCERFTRHAKI